MREIKFRAWNSEKKTMRIHDVVVCNGKQVIPVQTSGNDYWDATWEECENILMQSTGLKDKNGVEIYEGDIVKYNLSFPVGEIVFNRDRFTPIYDRSSYDEWELDFWRISDKCEVIGNVYETPELLDWEHIQTLELFDNK
jgi:uncharacterized phage protein (TIGR01671 family)